DLERFRAADPDVRAPGRGGVALADLGPYDVRVAAEPAPATRHLLVVGARDPRVVHAVVRRGPLPDVARDVVEAIGGRARVERPHVASPRGGPSPADAPGRAGVAPRVEAPGLAARGVLPLVLRGKASPEPRAVGGRRGRADPVDGIEVAPDKPCVAEVVLARGHALGRRHAPRVLDDGDLVDLEK